MIVDFVIISYHSHFEIFVKYVTTFLWQWRSFITDSIFKRKYESKKSMKFQPVRYMCHADTCVPPRNKRRIDTKSWTPLVQKKMCPLIRGVHFFKSWWILVLFSKIYYFYTYIWGSQYKWKTSVSLWAKKRKKEMMLNCCNLKLYSNIK